ncbi:MAG TPA: cupredoxin domain-containing protein [Candidatus Saccharimonadales bacterium]|nr:cupredoxin domain-containing protein [Candidatus Saccharimonadales bacterium]
MNKKAIIALGILVIVIAGAALWMLRKDPSATDSTNTTPTSSDSSQSSTPNDAVTPTGSETTITYSDGGYSPSSITVKAGDKVIIKNASSHSMQFDSDPHPAHTINPELNVGAVPAGQEMNFIVDTKGTFGYHNHLNPSQKGTIIVE